MCSKGLHNKESEVKHEMRSILRRWGRSRWIAVNGAIACTALGRFLMCSKGLHNKESEVKHEMRSILGDSFYLCLLS